jgi:coiled-coil and C2 domain-containing protein 2A
VLYIICFQFPQREFAWYLSNEYTVYFKSLITLSPLLPMQVDDQDNIEGGNEGGDLGSENFAINSISIGNVRAEDRSYAFHAQHWYRALQQYQDLTAHSASLNSNSDSHSHGAGGSREMLILSTPRRYPSCFVSNSKGEQVFLCRYLYPQPPPLEEENSLLFDTRRSCLHLVTCLPFMKDAQSFLGSLDLWCTGQEFWEIGAGDEEEHAIMLYNYWRYILDNNDSQRSSTNNNKRETHVTKFPTDLSIFREPLFLVLGDAIPEGDTVYILYRDFSRNTENLINSQTASNRTQRGERTSTSSSWLTNFWSSNESKSSNYSSTKYPACDDFLLINPCTGHIYASNDVNCPLQSIYLLVTPYNVYANIQASTKPYQLDYNVTNLKCWRPFFGYHCPFPQLGLSTIQAPITYSSTDPMYAQEIEDAVHQGIRNAFRRWRSKRFRATTTFHPQASEALQEILMELEMWKRFGDENRRLAVQSVNNSNQSQEGSGLDRIEQLIQQKMQSIVSNRQQLKGFPMHFPFTDVDEIIQKVKKFAVHENKHPNVQFVLSVRAIPLFNNIISLWIFVGALETHI